MGHRHRDSLKSLTPPRHRRERYHRRPVHGHYYSDYSRSPQYHSRHHRRYEASSRHRRGDEESSRHRKESTRRRHTSLRSLSRHRSESTPRRSSRHKKKNRSDRSKSSSKKRQREETSPSKPVKRVWKFDSPPRDETYGYGANESGQGAMDVAGLSCEQQKAARELYVGNLPPNLDVNQLIEFFNAAMLTLNSSGIPGNPVSRAWIAADGHFAFVEFRTIEEATIALQLNGLNCMGYTLRIGRPKTYPVEYSLLLNSTTGTYSSEPPPAAAALAAATAAAASVAASSVNTAQAMRAAQLAAAGLGIAKKPVVEKPCRLVLLDLPPAKKCPEEEVQSLLCQYGVLKIFQYFELPSEIENHFEDTGVCIFEYAELGQQKALEKAIQRNNFGHTTNVRIVPADEALRDKKLTSAMEKAGLKEALGGDLMKPQVPTRVIILTNIVTRQELLDDKEYFDIVDDITIECAHYGKVIAVKIPRPLPDGSGDESDVGYAFVKFAKLQEAGSARKALSGRKFAGRTVEAHYFNGRKFEEGNLKNPTPNYELDGRLSDESSPSPEQKLEQS